MKQTNELTDVKLPFKVRNIEPEVVVVSETTKMLPKDVMAGRLGCPMVVYKGKVYVYRKNMPKFSMEHEKAHTQIEKDKTKSPKGVISWLDDEIKADLLTYQKTGQPKSISGYLNARFDDARYYHLANDYDGRHNTYEHSLHSVSHLERAYKKYWEYLPEQWKRDYREFMNKIDDLKEQSKRKGYHVNPVCDFDIYKTRTGQRIIKRKKVIRKPDRITGFLTRQVA